MKLITLNPYSIHAAETDWITWTIISIFVVLTIIMFLVMWRTETPVFSEEQETRIRQIIKEEKEKNQK